MSTVSGAGEAGFSGGSTQPVGSEAAYSCPILERCRSSSIYWPWLEEDLIAHQQITALLEKIDQKLPANEKLELASKYFEGFFEEVAPKYQQARAATWLLRVAYSPESILGGDFQTTPWKKNLHEKALLFFESLEKGADLQIIRGAWNEALTTYAKEAFNPQNVFGDGHRSYYADELALTEEQKKLANPMTLMDELKRDDQAEVILLTPGSAGRADQEIPKYLEKFSDKKVKIFMVDPFFAKHHPKALNSDWKAVNDKGEEVPYSSRFTKGNAEAVVIRDGLFSQDGERQQIIAYLQKAQARGAQIFLGDHCSPVSELFCPIYNELLTSGSAPTLYSEHGGCYVKIWNGELYDRNSAHLLEIAQDCELQGTDFAKKVQLHPLISDEEKAKWIKQYSEGELQVGYRVEYVYSINELLNN